MLISRKRCELHKNVKYDFYRCWYLPSIWNNCKNRILWPWPAFSRSKLQIFTELFQQIWLHLYSTRRRIAPVNAEVKCHKAHESIVRLFSQDVTVFGGQRGQRHTQVRGQTRQVKGQTYLEQVQSVEFVGHLLTDLIEADTHETDVWPTELIGRFLQVTLKNLFYQILK